VTHNTEMVLPHADQVIVMADANASECRIRAAGTLEELRSQGIELNSNEFAGAPLEESDEEASAEKKGDKTDEKASEGKRTRMRRPLTCLRMWRKISQVSSHVRRARCQCAFSAPTSRQPEEYRPLG